MTDTVQCPNCQAEDPEVLYTDERDEFAEVVTDVADAEACSDCYTNDACPDGCNEPHDPPSDPSEYELWDCPTTGVSYAPTGMSWDVEWVHSPYGEGSVLIHDEWVYDPYSQGYSRCDGCSEWVYEDDQRWDQYGESCYCSGCYEDYGRGAQADHSRYARCTTCSAHLSGSVVFDIFTERTYCGEHAAEVHPKHARLVAA